MAVWLTIEVAYDEMMPVESWRRARGESLTEAAITHGAQDWVWHTPSWGVILELRFAGEQARDVFRGLPVVVAALDACPTRSSAYSCTPVGVVDQARAYRADPVRLRSPARPKQSGLKRSYSSCPPSDQPPAQQHRRSRSQCSAG